MFDHDMSLRAAVALVIKVRFKRGATLALVTLSMALFPVLTQARESLGMFANWGAFEDPATPRCYAIAKAIPSTLQRDFDPYVTVATWPRLQIRNQVYFQLSRKTAPGSNIRLQIGSNRFFLTGSGGNAWSKDHAMDAAITSAMRSARTMKIYARGRNGRGFSNTYNLKGAATAMDMATVTCAQKA